MESSLQEIKEPETIEQWIQKAYSAVTLTDECRTQIILLHKKSKQMALEAIASYIVASTLLLTLTDTGAHLKKPTKNMVKSYKKVKILLRQATNTVLDAKKMAEESKICDGLGVVRNRSLDAEQEGERAVKIRRIAEDEVFDASNELVQIVDATETLIEDMESYIPKRKYISTITTRKRVKVSSRITSEETQFHKTVLKTCEENDRSGLLKILHSEDNIHILQKCYGETLDQGNTPSDDRVLLRECFTEAAESGFCDVIRWLNDKYGMTKHDIHHIQLRAAYKGRHNVFRWLHDELNIQPLDCAYDAAVVADRPIVLLHLLSMRRYSKMENLEFLAELNGHSSIVNILFDMRQFSGEFRLDL
jgi:hypothetical protein